MNLRVLNSVFSVNNQVVMSDSLKKYRIVVMIEPAKNKKFFYFWVT
jgi:hypothetical protein